MVFLGIFFVLNSTLILLPFCQHRVKIFFREVVLVCPAYTFLQERQRVLVRDALVLVLVLVVNANTL